MVRAPQGCHSKGLRAERIRCSQVLLAVTGRLESPGPLASCLQSNSILCPHLANKVCPLCLEFLGSALCFRILVSQQWYQSVWLYTSCRMVALRPVLCQAPFKAPASIKAMPACLDTPAKRATESEEVCTFKCST